MPESPTCPSTDPLADTPAEALARAEAFGVDLSLLRENLRRTPAERLARHTEAAARVALFRQLGRAARAPLSRPR